MAVKKSIFIEAELEWAESQLASWKAYVDKNPFESLKDRKDMKETKTGGTIYQVVSTIENQGKFLQETMKNYLSLLREVNNMRELEDAKKSTPRGNQALSPLEEGML